MSFNLCALLLLFPLLDFGRLPQKPRRMRKL